MYVIFFSVWYLRSTPQNCTAMRSPPHPRQSNWLCAAVQALVAPNGAHKVPYRHCASSALLDAYIAFSRNRHISKSKAESFLDSLWHSIVSINIFIIFFANCVD